MDRTIFSLPYSSSVSSDNPPTPPSTVNIFESFRYIATAPHRAWLFWLLLREEYSHSGGIYVCGIGRRISDWTTPPSLPSELATRPLFPTFYVGVICGEFVTFFSNHPCHAALYIVGIWTYKPLHLDARLCSHTVTTSLLSSWLLR